MVRNAYLPTSNGIVITATRKIKGSGTGSVLLQKGGPGAGSSYSSVDDYLNTTGINANKPLTMSSGNGLNKINSSLEKLLVKSKGERKKEKNINFNL